MQNKVYKRAQSSIFYNEMEQLFEKVEQCLYNKLIESAQDNKSISKFKILTSIFPRNSIDYRYYINQQMIDGEAIQVEEEEQISDFNVPSIKSEVKKSQI